MSNTRPDADQHTQALLQQSRGRLNAMLESIGDAFFAVDHEWRVTYANRKAADFVNLDLDPELGCVPLGEFIGIAEETGLIIGIGNWMLQQACRQTRGLIDILKLDRSFVLADDGRISAFDFIKAFVDMAHALRMLVVAEGVETTEVQGYLLARPMPFEDLRSLLARG